MELVERTTGLTYAEYAREGFFELVAVAALVLPVLLVGDWLLGGRPRRVRGFRALAFVLVALLGVVMASALERLRLYRSEFGLTEARVYATAFALWLGVAFAWLCATVLRGRRDSFAAGALASAFAAVLVLNAVNPDALIARTNVARWEAGKPLDVHYLGALSDDATPTLVELLPALAAAKPSGAHSSLAHVLVERRETAGGDWRTWNWGRARAAAIVREHEKMLRAIATGGR